MKTLNSQLLGSATVAVLAFVGVAANAPVASAGEACQARGSGKYACPGRGYWTWTGTRHLRYLKGKRAKRGQRAVALVAQPDPYVSEKNRRGLASAKGGSSSAEDLSSPFSWKESFSGAKFRVAPIAAVQSDGYSVSTMISWNPELRFSPRFALVGSLAGTAFQNQVTNVLFFVGEGAVLADVRPEGGNLGLELGGGAQAWVGSGASPVATVGSYYRFKPGTLQVVERLVVDYSANFMSGSFTHEVRCGVGMSF